jgi:hypothetical protein
MRLAQVLGSPPFVLSELLRRMFVLREIASTNRLGRQIDPHHEVTDGVPRGLHRAENLVPDLQRSSSIFANPNSSTITGGLPPNYLSSYRGWERARV